MIVVLHESKTKRLEDASVFGPFASHEEARAFMEWAATEEGECDGRDMLKILLPVRVKKTFEYDDSFEWPL